MSSSSSSGPSKSSKRQSLSTIESSVTKLLVATKHLLESLTQWARQEADDKHVSDAYVKLGNDFRAACRAFSNAGVDVTDLGDVPHALRIVLEEALCETPSQESLDKFLPNIRKIIVTLLQNLKLKQSSVKSLNSEKQRSASSSHIQLEKEKDKERKMYKSKQRSISQSESLDSDTSNISANNTISNNNALAQLQKGDTLQRRASKRFSAYQYAKLTNYSPGRDPELPKTMNTELPKSQLLSVPSDNIDIKGDSNTSTTTDDTSGTVNVYLKLSQRTKKVKLSLPVTIASLRLLFVEKFAYSPGTDSFPDIYIQDNNSFISYEVEEHLLSEVREGSLLTLNEPDSNYALIKSLENQIGLLQKQVTSFNGNIVAEIKDAIKSIEIPSSSIQQASTKAEDHSSSQASLKVVDKDVFDEFMDVQQELKIIKQIQRTNRSNFKDSIMELVKKVQEFQASGFNNSKSSNRVYMENCHTKLSEDSDVLLTRVDDLQDIIEALRKDVAQRGARPTETQLIHVSKEITEATSAIDSLREYIGSEKSNWKKIWETELDTVCEEQQFFNLQEDLVDDLQEDLTKALETFSLVKQCCDEQSKNPRYRPAHLPIPEPGENIHDMRDALLSEVVALKVNHETRLAAIEKAEKLRRKEKELTKLNKFQVELGDFVGSNKLKKSGGVEEAERLRRQKDEENLKSFFGVV